MMRLLFYCLIFVLAIFIGLWIKVDPGYVLIAYRHWTVETPLWFFVIISVMVLFILHYGLSLWDKIENLIARWRYRRHWIDFYKTNLLVNQGLLEALKGKFVRAEKLLLKAAKKNQMPIIHCLALAYVMQMQNKLEKSATYLQKARESSPENHVAVDLLQAQLQLSRHDFKAAIATLQEVHELAPNNVFVLKLLKKTYLALEEWSALKELLPALQKVLTKDEYRELKEDIQFH